MRCRGRLAEVVDPLPAVLVLDQQAADALRYQIADPAVQQLRRRVASLFAVSLPHQPGRIGQPLPSETASPTSLGENFPAALRSSSEKVRGSSRPVAGSSK